MPLEHYEGATVINGQISLDCSGTHDASTRAISDPDVSTLTQAAHRPGWHSGTLEEELRLAKYDQIKDMIGLRNFDSQGNLELET
ncbi:hypothetical protein LCGC14_0112520 [marine sediment metagenome]|jgi:hypothetical protein|uniref:Uncharacterized protein n=2 Tax=root TaxID=1 RepID=A0A7V1FLU4_9RHOB|nr:hypothetical protein [Sulfitobacter litoralis]HDZ51480.1 hypothetical protein [Sulfitobacter litoralis]